jgi:putative tricarboxylic transport membrane protein
MFSMLTLLVLGVIGFLMEETGVPLAPAVLALVLEPLLETNLRRALQISGGDLASFVDRPVSLVLVLVCAAVMVSPLVSRLVTRRQQRTEPVSA